MDYKGLVFICKRCYIAWFKRGPSERWFSPVEQWNGPPSPPHGQMPAAPVVAGGCLCIAVLCFVWCEHMRVNVWWTFQLRWQSRLCSRDWNCPIIPTEMFHRADALFSESLGVPPVAIWRRPLCQIMKHLQHVRFRCSTEGEDLQHVLFWETVKKGYTDFCSEIFLIQITCHPLVPIITIHCVCTASKRAPPMLSKSISCVHLGENCSLVQLSSSCFPWEMRDGPLETELEPGNNTAVIMVPFKRSPSHQD